MMSLDHVAAALDADRTGNDVLASVLVARYATQDAIVRIVSRAGESLGGMSFIAGLDVAYLAGACYALALHPPARASMATALDGYFRGAVLVVA